MEKDIKLKLQEELKEKEKNLTLKLEELSKKNPTDALAGPANSDLLQKDPVGLLK